MSTTGEPQSLPPKLDFLELAGLLQLQADGKPFPCSRYIHEASPYSADPEDLVRGRDPAPVTGGKGMAWYFHSPVHAGRSARRDRKVGGGGERRFWHPEGGEKPILGQDGEAVGWAYSRRLSYVLKVKSAAKSFTKERLGWCMIEIRLRQQDGGAGQQWEICKLYRSPLPPSPSTAAAGEDVCPDARTGSTSGVADSANRRGMSIGDNITCPTPPPAASSRENQSMLLTTSTDIVLKSNITMLEVENTSKLGHNVFIFKTLSIFEDLGVSIDCMTTSQGRMSFALVPSDLLKGKLIKLAIDNAVGELQEYAGVHRIEGRSVISLTGNAQMSSYILEKALGVLRGINVNVHKSFQDPSKVGHVSLVVPDTVAEDCMQALRSEFHDKGLVPQVHGADKDLPVSSSSGFKRKALCEGVRTDTSSKLVVQQMALNSNDPIPDIAAGVLEDGDDYLSWSWLQQVEDYGVQGLVERTDTNGSSEAPATPSRDACSPLFKTKCSRKRVQKSHKSCKKITGHVTPQPEMNKYM